MELITIHLILTCILLAAVFAAPLITLTILAIHDWKTSTVINWQLILFAVSLIPYAIFNWIASADVLIFNIIFSAVFIGVAAVLMHTGKLASGDGLMIIPAAAAFGSSTPILVAGSLLFTAIFFFGRKREKKIPYAPGLLAAMAALLLPNIITMLGTIPAIL